MHDRDDVRRSSVARAVAERWRRMLLAILALVGTAIVSGCGEDPIDPPVTLSGEYRSIWSAYGDFPVRVDELWGLDWYVYVERVTIQFQSDGTYRLTQMVRDSFPTTGKVLHREWQVVGSYGVRADTVLVFTVDQAESRSPIAPREGRIRRQDGSRDRIYTDMLGITYERAW